MENYNINNFAIFTLTIPSNEYKTHNNEDKLNIEIYNNNNDKLLFNLLESQNKTYLKEEFVLLIIKVESIILNENKEKFIEIKYKCKNNSLFGSKIKINKNQYFYYNVKLLPLKDEKKEISFLPQLNLSYNDEFIIFLNCLSNHNITDKYKDIDNILVTKKLLLNYKDNKDEISFNFLIIIFSLCIKLKIPPIFDINKKILFDNDNINNNNNIKQINFDFFQNLIDIIIKNNSNKKIEEKEKNIILKISEIFCEYYYRFNKDILINFLNNKNEYILFGLLSLIEKEKITYSEILNNYRINKDNIIEFLIENVKNKKEIEKIIGFDNNFLLAFKNIDIYYNSIYKRYNEEEIYNLFGNINNRFNEPLSLPKIDNDIKNNDNLEKIILLYNNILKRDVSNNVYIIDYELIFNEIFEIFCDTNLITIEKIWKSLIPYNKNKEYLEDKYHSLIVKLGKKNKLSNKEVFLFLTQNKFYVNDIYEDSLKMNPEILISFNLEEDPKLNYFDDFKKNKIWNIFNSDNNKVNWFLFVEIFVDKINSIFDLLLINKLFSIDILSEQFFCQYIIKKILIEDVFQKSKEKNNYKDIEKIYYLLLKMIIKNINIFKNPSGQFLSLINNYSFITKNNNNEEKIYLYIININDNEITSNKKILEILINFFKVKLIKYTRKYNLLEFVKLFNNNLFLVEFFNNIEEIILNEEEFYNEVNSNKINYFLDYLKYYYELIQIDNINETKYFFESGNLVQKIFKYIMEVSFPYSKLGYLLKNKENNFYEKVLAICKFFSKEEEEVKSKYNKLEI